MPIRTRDHAVHEGQRIPYNLGRCVFCDKATRRSVIEREYDSYNVYVCDEHARTKTPADIRAKGFFGLV